MTAIRRAMTLLALLLVISVAAGCGSQTSTTRSTAQAPTATIVASTPTATPQPTVDPALLARCQTNGAMPNPVTQADDFLISQPQLDGLLYAPVELPDATPLKPLQVSVHISNLALRSGGAQFATAHAANPGGANGSPYKFDFDVYLCNSSASATHVVQSVAVRIAALTPYTGQLNIWPGCDSAYPHAMSGGCGGDKVPDELANVEFAPGATQGATMVTTESGTHVGGEPLPAHLAPGQKLFFSVGITLPVAPEAPSAYTFAIGFQTDGASTATFGQPASPVLFAPVAHTFTGTACNTPSMLAQIPPATTPETYHICPA